MTPKQTAVEWLEVQLNENGKLSVVDFYQAKEMEKEQSNEAFKHGEFWILQTIAEAVNNTTTKPLIPKTHD
jgi:hypothetical protein